jgi:hypothetical protein
VAGASNRWPFTRPTPVDETVGRAAGEQIVEQSADVAVPPRSSGPYSTNVPGIDQVFDILARGSMVGSCGGA